MSADFDRERVPPKELLPTRLLLFPMVTDRHYETSKKLEKVESISPCWEEKKNVLKTKASQLRDQSD